MNKLNYNILGNASETIEPEKQLTEKKEKIERPFDNVSSLEELFQVIRDHPEIPAVKNFHEKPEKLVAYLNQLSKGYHGSFHLKNLTNENGLRDKFIELMNKKNGLN